MNAVKHLVDRHLRAAARVYRKTRDKRWFAGLEEVHTSPRLILTPEPGLADAIPRSIGVPALQKLMRDQDVFVDVGAHLGLYSRIAAKMGKCVTAVEPSR